MNWFEVITLSIIEGLTEFLPISSTAHMVLWSAFVNGTVSDFSQTFIIVIQVGAIFAVLTNYWKTLLHGRKMILTLMAAFLPTALVAWLLYPLVKTVFLTDIRYTLLGLILGAIGLLIAEKKLLSTKNPISLHDVTIRQAVLIGLFQAVSVYPGISRSASIIISGILLGMSRKAAVEFSFLLGLPVLTAASGYELLSMQDTILPNEWIFLLAGGTIAFLVARLTINWLIRFVSQHSLTWFAYYRFIVVALFLLWLGL